MKDLEKYLNQIKKVLSEANISFIKNPIEALGQIISNPKNVKSFEKDYKKYESLDYFFKVLSAFDPKTKSKLFLDSFNYVNMVLKNSLEIDDIESNFLSLAICLRHIPSLNKLEIQKCIAKIVVKYRQNPKGLLYLGPIIEGAKDLSITIRNLISVALIQHIRAKIFK